MIIDDKKIKINRNYLIKKLEKNGIKGLGQGYKSSYASNVSKNCLWKKRFSIFI